MEQNKTKPQTINAALDIGTMPKGMNWMGLTDHVLDKLTAKQLKKVLFYALTRHGQSEHNAVYHAVKCAVGEEKTIELIELAKVKASKVGHTKK